MTRILRAAVLAIAAPLLCSAADADLERKVDELFRPVAGGGKPGAAVAVIRDGRTVLLKCYGMADVEKRAAITPATIFRLASVTKSFIATAVLQLVERGKVGLDDPLSKHVPDFPRAADIRIRHLLSHTSGIPDFISYEEVKKRPLEFEPGERINYSNNGYHLLGRVVEAASGQSWDEYLRAHVFGPLGMKNSGWDRGGELPGRATGYLLGKEGAYGPVFTDDSRGAGAGGGLYSTVEDLVRWNEGLAAGKVLRKETLERATTPGTLSDGRRTRYGFGWMTASHRGIREVAHGGDITGFNTWFAMYPDEKMTVIVLSNTGMRPPGPLPTAGDLAHRIVEFVAGERMEKADAAPVPVDAKTLDRYAGRYKLEAAEVIIQNTGTHLVITREGDRLMAEARGMKIPLVAKSQTLFQGPGSPVEITFVCGTAEKCPKIVMTLLGLREFQAVREE